MDWLWNSAVHFALGMVPTWAWIVIAGVAIGWAWRVFGWQGVVGGVAAAVTLGAYRQGWRDRDADKAPVVPVDRPQAPAKPNQPRRKIKTVMDFLNEWRSR